MEKENIPELYLEPSLEYLLRIPSVGSMEREEPENIQRGENNNGSVGNDSTKHLRDDSSREMVPR